MSKDLKNIRESAMYICVKMARRRGRVDAPSLGTVYLVLLQRDMPRSSVAGALRASGEETAVEDQV